MANVSQKTLSWLYDVLKREYRDPNRAYSDLAQTLSRYPTLSPRTDVYTFENGTPALLAHFVGVLPVNFRSNMYRFPVALWIPHAYPYEAPMIYVTPTDDMLVRPGQHVGGDGRIYHPYLAHWREAWDRSNVVGFLAILADVFAKEPPVMSKQQLNQRPQQGPPPPRPPLPLNSSRPPSHPQTLGLSQSGPPPPPPKQPASSASSIPSSPVSDRPGRYDAPPPLPLQPQSPGRLPSIHRPYPRENGDTQPSQRVSQYAPQQGSGLRQSMPPQPDYSQYQPQPQQWQSPSQQMPTGPGQTYHPHHPHQQQQPRPMSMGLPPPQAYSQQQPPQQQRQQGPPMQQPQPQQQQKSPAPDLLDSPFDIPLPATTTQTNLPAPPIPRNPEKDALLQHLSQQLTSTLHSQLQQNVSALPALHSQHQALTNALGALQSEFSNLNTLSSTLTSNISLLQSTLSQSDKTISSAHLRAKKGEIPSVDEMLVAPTVVGKQLYDTICEERGIEAGIWALQEGFVRGRIGGDVWAKRTRELAREGFRKKWIARKAGRGMGLDGA